MTTFIENMERCWTAAHSTRISTSNTVKTCMYSVFFIILLYVAYLSETSFRSTRNKCRPYQAGWTIRNDGRSVSNCHPALWNESKFPSKLFAQYSVSLTVCLLSFSQGEMQKLYLFWMFSFAIFKLLAVAYGVLKESYEKVVTVMETGRRMLGRYYRVAFYGRVSNFILSN